MANNNIEFFNDVLVRYDELKYNFEYGFKWDKNITKLLGKKGTDSYREVEAALRAYIYNGVATRKYDNKNPARKIVTKKPYSLNQTFWFQNLYGCYGMMDKKYEEIECPEKQREEGLYYEICRGDSIVLESTSGKCSYKQICGVRAKSEALCQLKKEGMTINDSKEYLHEIAEKFYKNYSNMIEKKEEKLYLKRNQWTEEDMKSILSEERYECFLEWISFFSTFTPLSVLGSNFLFKLRKKIQNRFFFVRGLEVGSGLVQESIYRCLCAIHQNRQVYYDDGNLYCPLKLIYRNNKMDIKNADVFLEAQREDRRYQLPLKDHYIRVSENRCRVAEKEREEQNEIQTIDYKVEFYTNSAEKRGKVTDYLEKRRLGLWREFCIEEHRMDYFKVFHSPYYPQNREWEVWEVVYRIPEEDQEGFKRYIMSFGEFASLKAPEIIFTNYDEVAERKTNQKGTNVDQYSLCNIFSAKGIWEENVKELRELKDVIFPPSEAELAWLDFIIQTYPNMSQIFLLKEELDQIHKKIQEEIENSNSYKKIQNFYGGDIKKKWFGENFWNCEKKTADCRKNLIEKYRKIYDAMKRKEWFCYMSDKKTEESESVIVLPYAMEFNVAKHLEFSKNPPFQIMCYDWKEKRNCLVTYKDIQVKNTMKMEELMEENTVLHQLYHVLAYAVRSALDEIKNEIGSKDNQEENTLLLPENMNHVLEAVWNADSRKKNSNYERCIKKRLKNYNEDYNDVYRKMEAVVSNHPMEQQIREFIQNVFYYWNEVELLDGSMEKKYNTFLLDCFCSACKMLKSPRKRKKLLDALKQITSDDMLNLILGKDEEQLLGEAAYYNEELKLTETSFSLIQNQKQWIDCVYDIFKSYNCKGGFDEQNRICFTVLYEKFNYRDIHKNLMAIRDMVDIRSIQPESIRDIIQKRIEAIRESRIK